MVGKIVCIYVQQEYPAYTIYEVLKRLTVFHNIRMFCPQVHKKLIFDHKYDYACNIMLALVTERK